MKKTATKKRTARKASIDDIVVEGEYREPTTAREFHDAGGSRYGRHLLDWSIAYKFLQAGVPVKRLPWMGYWQMEDGKLVMHCKDGSRVTLADCDNSFTLGNLTAKDWLPLTQGMKDDLDMIHSAGVLNYRKR